MPSYPNLEVEREVRSRITGAMEAATERRESELGELAGSKYAPGPGCGSGPYEQKRIEIYVGFYDTLFRGIVDNWFEVLTRQNGRVTASDADHIMKEVEEWACNAPRNIQQALISRGTTASRLPQGTITALGDNAGQKVHGLVTKYRRELQTRVYDQNHPHPKEIAPAPNVNITKINSDNVNSIVTSGSGNNVATTVASKKGWWETWWGTSIILVVTSVIAGLIIWGITRYLDKPSSTTPTAAETAVGKAGPSVPGSAPASKPEKENNANSEPLSRTSGMSGIWSGMGFHDEPLFYEFLSSGELRVRTSLEDSHPSVDPAMRWRRTGDRIVIEWFQNDVVSDRFIGRHEDHNTIEGERSGKNGVSMFWKLVRVAEH